MPSFKSVEIDQHSSESTFKQVILNIILAAQFVREFKKKHSKEKLRIALASYYREYKKEADPSEKEPRKAGGVDKAKDLDLEVNTNALITCYQSIKGPITAIDRQKAALAIGDKLIKEKEDPELNKQRYIDTINSFSYCQNLVAKKFPKIYDFIWSFAKEENPTSPDIKEFVDSKKILNHVTVDLTGTIKVPMSTGKKNKNTKRKPANSTESTTAVSQNSDNKNQEDLPPERCICYYLHPDRTPVLAEASLYWVGNRLDKAIVEQKKRYRGGQSPFTFISTAIVESEKTVFVILECTPTLLANKDEVHKLHLQITIVKEPDINGQRIGTYSSILYHEPDQTEPLAICGTIVLKTVNKQPDYKVLIQDLDKFNHYSKDGITKSKGGYEQLLNESWDIRYRLQNQIVSLPEKSPQDPVWLGLQRYVGKYVCYYLRLAKSRLETSHIEIFPDGSAKLEQPLETKGKTTYGYVQIDGNRVWMYFGFNEQTGHEPIRFLVDDTNPSDENNINNEPKLRGIFSSETKVGGWLVSGRMLMRKAMPGDQLKVLARKYQEVNYSDFEERGDLSFFTKGTLPEDLDLDTNIIRTDGPYWAEIANRLENHSAIDWLAKICTDETIDNKPFNTNKFYYYTFKADGDDEERYMIERNLVIFNSNGTVEIVAGNVHYQGYAYHLKNTLRLSLSNVQHGFLEVFLELGNDTYDLHKIKMLYGMSLWHSAHRLQGKTVVLSRFEPSPLNPKTEVFRFYDSHDTDFVKENRRIVDEDRRSGGVMSYLRGQINRYMHSTTRSLPILIRPRDQRFREMHFLVACFYGFCLRSKWPRLEGYDAESVFPPGEVQERDTVAETKLLEACRKHLKEAYIHGYGCSFAGLKINLRLMNQSKDYFENIYKDRFNPEKLTGSRIKTIVERIKQVANEQLFIQQAFYDTDGPLNHPNLHYYARPFWKELLDTARGDMSQTLQIPFDSPPSDPAT